MEYQDYSWKKTNSQYIIIKIAQLSYPMIMSNFFLYLFNQRHIGYFDIISYLCSLNNKKNIYTMIVPIIVTEKTLEAFGEIISGFFNFLTFKRLEDEVKLQYIVRMIMFANFIAMFLVPISIIFVGISNSLFLAYAYIGVWALHFILWIWYMYFDRVHKDKIDVFPTETLIKWLESAKDVLIKYPNKYHSHIKIKYALDKASLFMFDEVYLYSEFPLLFPKKFRKWYKKDDEMEEIEKNQTIRIKMIDELLYKLHEYENNKPTNKNKSFIGINSILNNI